MTAGHAVGLSDVRDACEMCGRPVDAHDRDIRFTLPDPVLDLQSSPTADGVWMSHEDPRTSVMMQVRDVGAFVRVLLPVSLSGGFSVTFGVWLGVHPDDLKRAFAMWWSAEYASLELEGRLANAIPPWGLLAAPVHAVVRDPDETPYCDTSGDPELARVLADEWPHDLVLSAIDTA